MVWSTVRDSAGSLAMACTMYLPFSGSTSMVIVPGVKVIEFANVTRAKSLLRVVSNSMILGSTGRMPRTRFVTSIVAR